MIKLVVTPEGQQEIDMTDDEIAEYSAAQTAQAVEVTASMAHNYSDQIQSLLNDTDLVSSRCFKAGVAFPADWLTYTQNLRTLKASADPTQAPPTKPTYPEGT